MENIGQGATPYLAMEIEDYDLTDAAVIWFSIVQGSVQLDLTGERITAVYEDEVSTLTVHLTQAETLAFSEGMAAMQVRWRDTEDEAYVSAPVKVHFFKALYGEVI